MTNINKLISFLISKACWTKLFSSNPNDHRRMKKIEEGLQVTRDRLVLIEKAVDVGDLVQAKKLLNEEFPFNEE